MKFNSQILTKGSGSIGGLTVGHNKGGMYMRSRAVPPNPRSAAQTLVRSSLQNAAIAWSNYLTPARRAGWETYAANVPVTDSLGNSINLSGINMFCRTNSIAFLYNGNLLFDAPIIFNRGDTPLPNSASLDTAGAGLTVLLIFSPAATQDGTIGLFISRPQNPGKTFFNGPYRFQSVSAVTTSDASESIVIAPGDLIFPYAPGQRLFYRLSNLGVDARLSPSITGFADAT